MIRVYARTLAVAIAWVVASGHVGSPDTWYEGKAGPYRVMVRIEPQGVVPGVARVYAKVIGDRADRVTIQTNRFDAVGAAPPPEPTERVAGDEGAFTGKLWIMTSGSNSVTVNVHGSKGSGSVVVPVVIVAYSRVVLPPLMGIGLTIVGMVLLAGLVTIVGAAVREGSLEPGEPPTALTRVRARKAMALTTLLLGVALVGGWKWWNAEEASYVRSMYKPLGATASVENVSGRPTLTVSIADSAWINRNDSAWLGRRDANAWTPLVADHGKLMHVFAIRDDMSAFAHLHPSTTDSVAFVSPLPPVPAGRYRVFADIVHESGFTHTMVASVDVSVTGGTVIAALDPDDAWFGGAAVKGAGQATLDDGAIVKWARDGGPLAAGQPASLNFEISNGDGSPASLEPYMGMAGHAVVQRSDGSVFVHLHPMGTISVASKMAFEMRTPGDTVRGLLGKRITKAAESSMDHGATAVGRVSFPYAFPKSGEYRVWVQVKRSGRIMTAAFNATVADAPPVSP